MTEARVQRVAVVGYGSWATRFILPALVDSARAELVAVCGRDAARARRAAAEAGASSELTDLGRLLEAERIDAVFVATPTAAHAEAVEPALAAGCAVFCEKPLGVDAAETRRLLDAAAGARTAVGFTNRFSPTYRALAAALVAGRIGTLREVAFTYAHAPRPLQDASLEWRYDARHSPLGVLGDLGSHAIDLLLWWFGPVHQVRGTGRTVTPGATNLGACDLAFEFASGVTGTLHCSRVADAANHDLEIRGNVGTLRHGLGDPGSLIIETDGATERTEIEAPLAVGDSAALQARLAAGRNREIDEVLRHFAGEPLGSDFPTFAHAHACQRVLDAAALAIETGDAVAVDEAPVAPT